MFLKLLIISVIFMMAVFAGFGVRLLLRKGGNFPETHVSRNKDMQKLGLSCAQHTDIGCIPAEGSDECACCEKRL